MKRSGDERASSGLPAIVIPSRRPPLVSGTTPISGSQAAIAIPPVGQTRSQTSENDGRSAGAISVSQPERATSSPEIPLVGGLAPSTPLIDLGVPRQHTPRTDANLITRGQSPGSSHLHAGLPPQTLLPGLGPISPAMVAMQDLFSEFTSVADQKLAGLSTSSIPLVGSNGSPLAEDHQNEPNICRTGKSICLASLNPAKIPRLTVCVRLWGRSANLLLGYSSTPLWHGARSKATRQIRLFAEAIAI